MSDVSTHYYGDGCDPPHVEGASNLPANPNDARRWVYAASAANMDPAAQWAYVALTRVLTLCEQVPRRDDLETDDPWMVGAWDTADRVIRAINETLRTES